MKIEIVPKAHPGRRSKVVRHSHKGRNRVALQRLVRRRHLREGSYRVFVVARNDEGSSRRHKTRFRVL